MKIAIQGFEGCFHQVAAQEFFGKQTEVESCASFAELIRKVKHQPDVDAGIMAIENSIAGSILPNYTLIKNSGLHITGEIYLQINQHLMTLPGQSMEDIREVHSHPMALLQCMDFLEKYPHIKLVETEDTALSARHVRQKKLKTTAAIAGKLAADIFELEIIAPNIHTNKNNYTRFLAVSRNSVTTPPDANKASVYFQTSHDRGSLAKVLTKIADAGINLSKLQSFPIPAKEWNYYFHADMEFDNPAHFEKGLGEILPLTEHLKVLGIYKKGNTH
ncbi:prephenate dehydratase [Chitinophaga nivalis]|uniref:prephenate dehydratase n=1 Tax=Chitinophaga nivalis TaxID=2991709 RepID=A0ABT3IFW3_9BACT|nr:prephenate dehydratase [Chitinophaga nivalis]MCW3467465.1 prephenate dehydratase [Chitinophaga nivalis]MCW3482843.1 prephenate dehydratase [Chitinophaga nivalis]